MNIQKTIKSWKWRIVKAGYTATSFGGLIGVSHSLISQYITGTANPSLKRFEQIEKKLKELGV